MLKWMLYATLVAVLAGLAAVAWERAASLRRLPSRWAWMAALALSVAIPLAHTLAPVTVSERFLEVVGAPSITGFDIAASKESVSIQRSRVQKASMQTIDQWLGVLWLCSSAGVSLMFALALHAVRREQRRGNVAIVAGHPVVITESLGPAVVGITNPTILVPGWIRHMSERQREIVIAHELQHVRARDEWLIGAAICVLIIFPWNVALWWHLKRLRLAIELDCDQRVLRAQFGPKEYGQVLIDAASLGAHDTAVAPALIESTSSLEKRIRAMLRSRAAHDKPLMAILGLASLAICATAAAVNPPTARPWTPRPLAGSVNDAPRVLSPPDELDEQWQSLVRVIEHFEPGVLSADRPKTAFIFLAIDNDGRVVGHHLEFRPSWQTNPIPSDELQDMFVERVGQPTSVIPMFLQLRLASKRFGPNPAMVMLGVNPSANAIDVAAPAIDMSAIRRDRQWLERELIAKTENERAIIELADSAALEVGLNKETELWIALTDQGEFIQGGRRNVITDPNESRRFVEQALPATRIGYVARGTAVRDASGNRVAVAWHWLQKK